MPQYFLFVCGLIALLGCGSYSDYERQPVRQQDGPVTVRTHPTKDLASSAQDADPSAKIDVRCLYLWLPTDFFDDSDGILPDTDDSVHRLTEIESFFLIQRKNQTLPKQVTISSATFTRVFDEISPDGPANFVDISGASVNGTDRVRLDISAPESSRFTISSAITTEIPNGGSVVVRTANSPKNSHTAFLWIITRMRDRLPN